MTVIGLEPMAMLPSAPVKSTDPFLIVSECGVRVSGTKTNAPPDGKAPKSLPAANTASLFSVQATGVPVPSAIGFQLVKLASHVPSPTPLPPGVAPGSELLRSQYKVDCDCACVRPMAKTSKAATSDVYRFIGRVSPARTAQVEITSI